MTHSLFAGRHAARLLILSCVLPAAAQSLPAPATAVSAPAPATSASASATSVSTTASAPTPRSTVLAPVLVTGNPLGRADHGVPASVLTGDELVLRRGSSLGETLNGQPGVSSNYFGPNANRPVIRGLDGDRVRMLSNSGASFDASSLSFDHAVPIDPLAVERIEVLRGPSALLYGGSAIGGVVNAIDNRIPKYRLEGVSGSGEVRFGGAERERASSALVEAGNGSVALHVDAFGRETSDTLVPRYTPVEADGSTLDRTDHIRNSAAKTWGGAAGGSLTFGSGYVGLSADTYDNRYGLVAEADTIIRMKRNHVALAGGITDLAGPVRAVRAQLNDTRYRHEEIEGTGEIGTTFRTSGTELRVEVEHAPLGPLKGVVGVQAETFNFSALGEEAFVPTTNTHRRAAFLVEELASPLGALTGGIRFERADVDSDGDADPADLRFGPARKRSFTLRSASLGDIYKLSEAWSLSGNLSTTARAPTSFELYANGLHVATGAFERGSVDLGVERGNNVDVALQWKAGDDRVRLGAFAARFSRYLSLESTGNTVATLGEDGQAEDFPEFEFRAIKAQLVGLEFEGVHRIALRGATLDLTGKLDYTRAKNRDTGEPLPRIAPLRATVGVDARTGPWLGRAEVEHANRQNRYADFDRETPSYSIFNVALSRHVGVFGGDAYVFLKATNLTDERAYNASTVETIRGLVPLPGRAVKVGLHVAF